MSLIIILICDTCSRKTIFYVPGLGNSPLYATISNISLFPNCINLSFPLNTKTKIWPMVKGYEECNAELLDVIYNNSTNSISSPEGVFIETDSIYHNSSEYFLQSFNDVYTIPYNWISYYLGSNPLFEQLKALIEQNFNTTNSKAVVVGYSLGANFVRYFLTRFSNENWVKKYVDSSIYIAPGFAGEFTSFIFTATSSMEFVGIKGRYVQHMPSRYAMWPNFPLSKNVLKINDIQYDASELFSLLVELNIVDETGIKIYHMIEDFLTEDVPDPKIHSAIIYNSGLPVQCGIEVINDELTLSNPINLFKKNKETSYTKIMCGGDGHLEAKGSEYACNAWGNVDCIDFKSSDNRFEHGAMGNTPELKKCFEDFININSNNIFTPLVIGIIIGGAILLIVLVIISTVLILKKRRKKTEKQIIFIDGSLIK
ncbi:hypothetical protein TRFO_29814 [Tritrichomonas foetus]|uniref:Lecithin:cholesterol acyltransferase family protein n=1 Tax=Tritrichomonas foetus TaxID=1144522 RepID=A0A1J4JVA0_9EUKA|nr:hypothetical protein TRFO_29814 [Tritrichomonas foetus]|eukprot:OHT02939.1 hypothetical protein TRFO_29814 [Tritrichomonas foetus]